MHFRGPRLHPVTWTALLGRAACAALGAGGAGRSPAIRGDARSPRGAAEERPPKGAVLLWGAATRRADPRPVRGCAGTGERPPGGGLPAEAPPNNTFGTFSVSRKNDAERAPSS